MKNLAHDFLCPNILDLKMGQVTYDPEATPEKKEHEIVKYPPLKHLGFQITGMMMHDPESGAAQHFEKALCRSLTADTMVTEGLGMFFGLGYRKLRQDVVLALLVKLRDIEGWFLTQKTLAFYASSLLIVYSSIPHQGKPSDHGKCRLSEYKEPLNGCASGQGRCSADVMVRSPCVTCPHSQPRPASTTQTNDTGSVRGLESGLLHTATQVGPFITHIQHDVEGSNTMTHEQTDEPSPRHLTTQETRESPSPRHLTTQETRESPSPKHLRTQETRESPSPRHLTTQETRESPSPRHLTTQETRESPSPRHLTTQETGESPCPRHLTTQETRESPSPRHLTTQETGESPCPRHLTTQETRESLGPAYPKTHGQNDGRSKSNCRGFHVEEDSLWPIHSEKAKAASVKRPADSLELKRNEAARALPPRSKSLDRKLDHPENTVPALSAVDDGKRAEAGGEFPWLPTTEATADISPSSGQTACEGERNAALVEVRMIDFAHVFPSSARDDNYLFGLQKLITFLEQLLAF
ncbi:uncharacterized protein [Littorina saxatilis]